MVVGRYDKKTRPIANHLKRSFKYVYDPKNFIRTEKNNDSINNICLPVCVLIALEYSKNCRRKLLKINIKQNLKYLKFESLLEFGSLGIPLRKLKSFEDLNYPFNHVLLLNYPILNFMKGFSINVYRLTYANKTRTYRLFPVLLSRFCHSSSYFQIDLIFDSEIFYQSSTKNNQEHQKIDESHFLVTTRLLYMLQSFHLRNAPVRYTFYKYLCRSCLTIYSNLKRLNDHFNICRGKGVFLQKRKKHNNILVHTPLLKYGSKTVKNGLRFERGMVSSCLKSLCNSWMDFESLNVKPQCKLQESYYDKDELGVYEQIPIGVSWAHHSNYDKDNNFCLPESLSQPRCFFRDESSVSAEDFYLKILSELRKDIMLISKFHEYVLESDFGTPKFNDLSLAEKIFFLTKKYCSLCGKFFNKTYLNYKTKKKYIVKKVKDHSHYLKDSKNFRSGKKKKERKWSLNSLFFHTFT